MSFESSSISANEQLSDFSDHELLQCFCEENDNDAFAVLYERHKENLYLYVCSLGSQDADADEICNETWLRVMKKARSFNGGNFSSWICTIARHIRYSRFRRKSFDDVYMSDAPLPANSDSGTAFDASIVDERHLPPEEEAMRRESIEKVQEGLGLLPKDDATAMRLRYKFDWTVTDVAEAFNKKPNTMYQTLYRIRQKLGEYCADVGINH